MRNSQYAALFKGKAETHGLIRHRDNSPRFARIIVSIDPLQRQVDLLEMQETLLGRLLKPNHGEQVLVLESLQTQYTDNQGDHYQRRRRGAFFILEQVPKGQDHWLALDRTEQTGEEILGAILADYADDVQVRWPIEAIQSDAVGPLHDGTWYGTRFDLEFTTPANAALAYRPEAFPS
ncbi:hypothetical protein Q5H93_12455 [Hymenobacter sp. ASUV-10]|uniref:Uncharacterized protein n=1 Tax=Hymenobacter aranciens TaxID=3063996 RepID=A0ABT9BET3_9BACT|nr:hypothetical protein [Hymenobacter sp. ASUV-10]MDO7875547.1 hypothetical protein [Hymenobacter sp. ASUV-10]